MTEIVRTLLVLQMQTKLFHWYTKRYRWHKISDELHGQLVELTDRLVEAFQGLSGARIPPPQKLLNLAPLDKSRYVARMQEAQHAIRAWKLAPELDNIRQEILAAIARALYLFSLG